MSKELTISCKKDILLKMNNLNKLEQKLLFLILSKINPIKDNANQTKLIKLSKQHIKEVLNLTYD